MPQNHQLKRLLDAGVHFTQLTQQRAEAIVRDLVKAGEVQAEQAQTAVADLLARSRQNTDKLVAAIRGEVKSQVASFEAVSRETFARLEKQVEELRAQLPGAVGTKSRQSSKTSKPAAKKASAKKATGKKAGAKKTPAKKAAAKKTAAG